MRTREPMTFHTPLETTGGLEGLLAGLAFSLMLPGFALYQTVPGEWPRTVPLLLLAAQLAVSALTERITRHAPCPLAVGS